MVYVFWLHLLTQQHTPFPSSLHANAKRFFSLSLSPLADGWSFAYERFTTVDKRDCSSLPLICSCNFFLTVLKHIYYLMNNIYTQTLEISFQTSKQFIICILTNLNYHTAIKRIPYFNLFQLNLSELLCEAKTTHSIC